MKPKSTFEWLVRVYYEDTDAGGIVYHANYLKYMERARTEWLRSLGFEQDELLEQSIGFVVKSLNMENVQAARFNDKLSIFCQIVKLKRASLVFEQKILNEQQDLLVQALVRVACVNLSTMRPKAIPKNMLGEFSSVV